MTVPAQQHNARRGDDTNYNFRSGRYTHKTILLPLPGTRNYTSSNFCAGLDRQVFWGLFYSLAVVAYIVLRFWDIQGRGWLFWERSSSAHLPHVPQDQWKILVLKRHLLSWYCNRKFPIPCLNCLQQDLYLCLCYTSLLFGNSVVLCGPSSPMSWGHLCHGQAVDAHTSTAQSSWDCPICTRAQPRCKRAHLQGSWWVSMELSILATYMYPLSLTICCRRGKPMHIEPR